MLCYGQELANVGVMGVLHASGCVTCSASESLESVTEVS
jgi:hypothetical protein